MLQPVDNQARQPRNYWLLRVPSAFTTIRPKFSLGQFVPMDENWQKYRGVTIYGQIVGISMVYEEWEYTIMAPEWHPACDDFDTALESELIGRMEEE